MAILYREFIINQPSVLQALIKLVKLNANEFIANGKPLRIIVTSSERKRNTEQNARYWAILTEIADNAWVNGKQFIRDVWHEHFCREFGLCDDITMPTGEVIITRVSTTKMTVAEFSEYMQKIEVYAISTLGVQLCK